VSGSSSTTTPSARSISSTSRSKTVSPGTPGEQVADATKAPGHPRPRERNQSCPQHNRTVEPTAGPAPSPRIPAIAGEEPATPRARRATRRYREPPSDAEIERGLRERAVSDPRAAEILLRWLQRPRAEERVGGVDLDSMSERELERLYAGLLKLAALPNEELRALVRSLLAETEDD
jgi:hypothetical protein